MSAKPKKPKVRIRRTRTALGWGYRVHVEGVYMGTAFTLAAARASVPRMVALYEKQRARVPRA